MPSKKKGYPQSKPVQAQAAGPVYPSAPPSQGFQGGYPPGPGAPAGYPQGPPPPYSPYPQGAPQAPPQGYPPPGHPPQQVQYIPPQPQTVYVEGGFDAGARFGVGATPNIPPPPPGCAPNAAQMAQMQGHNVVITQQKGNFLTGGSDGGYTIW